LCCGGGVKRGHGWKSYKIAMIMHAPSWQSIAVRSSFGCGPKWPIIGARWWAMAASLW